MSVEFKVTGDAAEAIADDIAFLAEQFGVVAGAVRFERTSEDTIVGTALGVMHNLMG